MSAHAHTIMEHPAAWTPQSLGGKEGIAIDLQARHLRALRDALAKVARQGLSTGTLRREDFGLPAIADDISMWRQQLTDGNGVLLLRGFPTDQHCVDELELMFLGLGAHFALPVSQSNMGDRVGHVRDVGGKDKRERAYRNSRELNLHTDRCDYIGMLCIRAAKEGGISGYASAVTMHNVILRERPELLTPLFTGYRLHRFGEQPDGEAPVTEEPIPVFSSAKGFFNVIYLRGYVDMAVEEGHYLLTPLQLEALDYFDSVANRSDVRLNFKMEAGEATFTNNCLLLHTRTAFEDSEEEQRKRLLLRLWLMDSDRPLAKAAQRHKSIHGIGIKSERGTYYQPESDQ